MSDEKPIAPTKEDVEAWIAELDRISHEAARVYALMIHRDPKAWDKFLADIKVKGQEHPIIFNHEGVLLAGRTRWLACKFLAIEPKVEVRDLTGAAAIEFIRSDNNIRRHDDIATLGMQQAKLLELMKADPKTFGPAPTQVKAAAAAGMSDTSLRVVQKLRKTHPDIAAEVENKKLTIDAAKKPSKEPTAEQEKKLAAIRTAPNKKEAKKILKGMVSPAAPKPKVRNTSRALSSNGSSKISIHAAFARLFQLLDEVADELQGVLDKHEPSVEELDELIKALRKPLLVALHRLRSKNSAAAVPDEEISEDTQPTMPEHRLPEPPTV